MDIDKIYSLVAKYLSGECSAGERADVEHWRDSSPEAAALYAELSLQWEASRRQAPPAIGVDREKVWSRIANAIKPARTFSKRMLWSAAGAAAVVALAAGISLTYLFEGYSAGSVAEMTLTAPAGQKSQALLPDGTQVWLNSGSMLTLAPGFGKKSRNVTLQGEAYFDVAPGKRSSRFTVHTDRVDVVVHGTAFDVSAYPGDPEISVALDRGSVELRRADSNATITFLTPGKKAVLARESGICGISDFDSEINNTWIYGKMIFRNSPAAELFGKMERWYGVDIEVENTPPQTYYWTTIQTESLTEMLNVIDKITPIEFSVEGDNVTVRYK